MAASWQNDRGGVVYGLFDPRTGELRYIGKTQQGLGARMRSHLHKAQKHPKEHRDWWIRKLLQVGVRPDVEILESWRTAGELEEAESWNIAYFRGIGCRLTNKTEGGEGASGYRHSPEARRRMSEFQKGRKHGFNVGAWRVPPERVEEVVRAYQEGFSLDEVGEKFGVTGGAVRKILLRAGVARRNAAQGRWIATRHRAAGGRSCSSMA